MNALEADEFAMNNTGRYLKLMADLTADLPPGPLLPEVVVGPIMGEFACADEAKSFARLMRLQGKDCTVTSGVNYPLAVRLLITAQPLIDVQEIA